MLDTTCFYLIDIYWDKMLIYSWNTFQTLFEGGDKRNIKYYMMFQTWVNIKETECYLSFTYFQRSMPNVSIEIYIFAYLLIL